MIFPSSSSWKILVFLCFPFAISWKYLVFISPKSNFVVFPLWYHLISSSLRSWISLVLRVCFKSTSHWLRVCVSAFLSNVSNLDMSSFSSLSCSAHFYFWPNLLRIVVAFLFCFAICQGLCFLRNLTSTIFLLLPGNHLELTNLIQIWKLVGLHLVCHRKREGVAYDPK